MTAYDFWQMRVNDLIEAAASNQLLSSYVESVAREMRMTLPELMDEFARTVAAAYLAGRYSYGFADMAMNQLFAFAHVETKLGLSKFAWKVFAAFDEGEYVRDGVSIDEQGEALTRKLLGEIESLSGD